MAGRTKTAEKLTPGGWLRVYWLCFGACLLVAAALLAFAPRLAQYGLTGYLVYLVLVPLGLGAAGFLSGAMRSLARYEGKLWFGALRLGGPVVVFGLVVLGGFFLGQPAGTLQLAVRVYGPGGSGDVVRRGSVRLIVGQATLVAPIDGNGAAYFPEVPAKFRGQPVAIEPEVEGYRARDPGPRPLPADGVLRLDLEKTVRSTTAAGTVLATDGRPVAGASVNLESGLAVGTTDGLGNFKLEVKGAEKDRLRLIVV
ncbi:MAG TPA: hypothetical protein VOA87_04365, partial [Thermoanaerobaculia bacterium]|nr:hypothetical protein [Thermoanaerobaculia bacterium]